MALCMATDLVTAPALPDYIKLFLAYGADPRANDYAGTTIGEVLFRHLIDGQKDLLKHGDTYDQPWVERFMTCRALLTFAGEEPDAAAEAAVVSAAQSRFLAELEGAAGITSICITAGTDAGDATAAAGGAAAAPPAAPASPARDADAVAAIADGVQRLSLQAGEGARGETAAAAPASMPLSPLRTPAGAAAPPAPLSVARAVMVSPGLQTLMSPPRSYRLHQAPLAARSVRQLVLAAGGTPGTPTRFRPADTLAVATPPTAGRVGLGSAGKPSTAVDTPTTSSRAAPFYAVMIMDARPIGAVGVRLSDCVLSADEVAVPARDELTRRVAASSTVASTGGRRTMSRFAPPPGGAVFEGQRIAFASPPSAYASRRPVVSPPADSDPTIAAAPASAPPQLMHRAHVVATPRAGDAAGAAALSSSMTPLPRRLAPEFGAAAPSSPFAGAFSPRMSARGLKRAGPSKLFHSPRTPMHAACEEDEYARLQPSITVRQIDVQEGAANATGQLKSISLSLPQSTGQVIALAIGPFHGTDGAEVANVLAEVWWRWCQSDMRHGVCSAACATAVNNAQVRRKAGLEATAVAALGTKESDSASAMVRCPQCSVTVAASAGAVAAVSSPGNTTGSTGRGTSGDGSQSRLLCEFSMAAAAKAIINLAATSDLRNAARQWLAEDVAAPASAAPAADALGKFRHAVLHDRVLLERVASLKAPTTELVSVPCLQAPAGMSWLLDKKRFDEAVPGKATIPGRGDVWLSLATARNPGEAAIQSKPPATPAPAAAAPAARAASAGGADASGAPAKPAATVSAPPPAAAPAPAAASPAPAPAVFSAALAWLRKN